MPLTDNPNAPNMVGLTPYSLTKNEEIRKILTSAISNSGRSKRVKTE